MQALPPWWIVNKIIPGGEVRTVGSHQEITFSGDQQKNFGIDAQGNVLDKEKFDALLAKMKQIRQDVKMPEVTLDDFAKWRERIPSSKIAHIKGFGSGIGKFYNDEVLALLKECELLVWDGDGYKEDSFTQIVPLFLASHPDARAVAFKLNYETDILKDKWASVVKKFPGRIFVVPVELIPPANKDAVRFGIDEEVKKVPDLPDWAQEYFILGRVASKATGSKTVISLGGGGIAANEASVGIDDGQQWHIFALSRGKKEQFPSLLNFAAAEPRAKLIKGKDPNESDGFGPQRTEVSAASPSSPSDASCFASVCRTCVVQ